MAKAKKDKILEMMEKDPQEFARFLYTLINPPLDKIAKGDEGTLKVMAKLIARKCVKETREYVKSNKQETDEEKRNVIILSDIISIVMGISIDPAFEWGKGGFGRGHPEKIDRISSYNHGLKINTHEEIESIRRERKEKGLSGKIRILDIGCGNGIYLHQIEKEQSAKGDNDISVFGTSLSKFNPFLIKNCILGTAHPYFPFQDNIFDMVVSWQSPVFDYNLGHLERLLNEAIRVTRENGRIYWEVWQASSANGVWQWYFQFLENAKARCRHVETGSSGTDNCKGDYTLLKIIK